MKKLLLILLGLLLGCGLLSAQTEPNNYVSIRGKFYIEYPADWQQVPSINVDRYLASRQAGRPLYDYDAVFAPKTSDPYYEASYLIMGLEMVGNLSDTQIDSVLNVLSDEFGKGIKYFPVANFMADLKSNSPNYDKATKTVSIYNKIVQDKTSIKNSLIIMKFYEFGIVTFYCYAIGDDFEADKKIFGDIAASLSTEDIKSKIPKEHLKVADIEPIKKNYGDSDKDNSNTAIYVSLGVVLFIILMRKRRKKNS